MSLIGLLWCEWLVSTPLDTYIPYMTLDMTSYKTIGTLGMVKDGVEFGRQPFSFNVFKFEL